MKHVTTLAALALAAGALTSPALMAQDHAAHHGNPAKAPGAAAPQPGDMPCHHMLKPGPADHGSHTGHGTAANAADNASTRAFKAANASMHAGMDIIYTGDADVDFLRGMIAHHQGAVDMAQVVLDNGKNPQVRRLARDIIRAQNLEIKWMKEWLLQMDKNPDPKQPPLPEAGSAKPKWHDAAWDGSTWMGER